MVDYTLEPAEDQPPPQNFMLEPAEEPSTRGRLQPLISQLTPEEPQRQPLEPSNESLLERLPRYGSQLIAADKYLLDTNRYWDDTVSNFTAGIKGVEDAISAAEDKNRPWYERGMAAIGQVPYAVGMTAVSSVTGPPFQAVGGALEKLTGGAYSSDEFQAAMMIPGMFGGAKYAELKEPPPSFKPAPIRPIEGSPNPGLLRSAGARTGVPEVDAVLNHPIIHSVLDNAVIDDTHEIPNSWGGSVPLDNPITYRDKDFPKTLTVDGVTFDTAEPAIIHENVEEFVIDKLMEGGMSRDAALRAAYWGWGNPAEHAWYRAHGMDPDHVEAALRPYLDKIASRKANEANIPSDLFRETYPDGNPLKDTSGEIEKPTAEEAARAQEIIRNNTGPRITGGTVDRPDVRVAQDLGIIGPERPSINEGTPEEAARNAVPATTAYHGSPYSFDAFDMGKIGTGEGAQSYGYGLYFAENPDVARTYKQDNAIAGEQNIAARFLDTFGTHTEAIKRLEASASAETPLSATEKKAVDLLKSGWEPQRGQLYQVRINADPEHFLDWDKPLSEQSEHVQRALKPVLERAKENRAAAVAKMREEGGLSTASGTAIRGEGRPDLITGQTVHEIMVREANVREPSVSPYEVLSADDKFQLLKHDRVIGTYATRAEADAERNTRLNAEFPVEKSGAAAASQALREAGIPGIKYLDQGSRRTPEDIDAEIKAIKLSIQRYHEGAVLDDRGGVPATPQAGQAEIARLQSQRGMLTTRNFVVFDHNDVEITHRNGVPVKPETPPTPPTKQEPPPADSWRTRFEHFVDRIQTADDIKQLIRMAADENQNFLAARRGDIPLAQVEKIADASGMDTAEVLKSGVGRQLRNDDQVDLAMRIMLRTTDSAKDMAKQLMTDQSDQNFIKFQEALMRRDLAVEQIVGLRAEWGRTGNVFQKFMKEVKDGQALDKFISETCPL